MSRSCCCISRDNASPRPGANGTMVRPSLAARSVLYLLRSSGMLCNIPAYSRWVVPVNKSKFVYCLYVREVTRQTVFVGWMETWLALSLTGNVIRG